jgi:predicted ribosomally synthesized peptide with nif11-like leader
MSKESANNFLQRMKEDVAFRGLIESMPRETRTRIIREEGYHFCADDLMACVSEVPSQGFEPAAAGVPGLCGLSPKFAY